MVYMILELLASFRKWSPQSSGGRLASLDGGGDITASSQLASPLIISLDNHFILSLQGKVNAGERIITSNCNDCTYK